jgi:hypothetical protein
MTGGWCSAGGGRRPDDAGRLPSERMNPERGTLTLRREAPSELRRADTVFVDRKVPVGAIDAAPGLCVTDWNEHGDCL